jgi:hypothetical protein
MDLSAAFKAAVQEGAADSDERLHKVNGSDCA